MTTASAAPMTDAHTGRSAEAPLSISRAGDIAVVRLAHPPVNALSRRVIAALEEMIGALEADRTVVAVVIHGAGRMFSSGGDLTEFSSPAFTAQGLNDVLRRIESLDRPVVAAVHGAVLGGGLEVAMACHFRVAAPGTTFRQPEVLLGFPPGSLGTQRLPRLVGLRRALAMLVQAETLDAKDALEAGLIDAIDERSPEVAGLAFARNLLASGRRPRRTREQPIDTDGVTTPDLHRKLQEAEGRRDVNPALHAAIRCVQAGLHSFAEGAAVEAELFDACRKSSPSRALQHLFFAERATAKIPGMAADVPRRTVRTVGIVGAGTMGAGIAMSFLNAGLPVVLLDAVPAGLERGVARVRELYEASASRGRLTREAVAARLGRLTATLDDGALAACDVIVEAVFEEAELKRQVLARLATVARPGAIVATNTSTLDVDALALASGRPADVLGTHFFSPANVMPLLEVVRGAATAPDVLATILDLAKRIGKIPVVSGVCYGFIGNRMAEVYMREAEFLLMEGATPAQIDGAVEDAASWGMAMGPCRMLDMAGIDVGAKTVLEWEKSGRAPGDPRYRAVCKALFAAGRYGQKSGVGYYRYEGRAAVAEPGTERICIELAARHGIARRTSIASSEIVERLLYPMINEAARILEEGIALRPGDIDVVWTSGYGFPRHRGGPVFMADEIGLRKVVEGLARYARQCGNDHGYWTASALLRDTAMAHGRLSAFLRARAVAGGGESATDTRTTT